MVYYLLKYSYVMKLREEIDGVAKRVEISDPVTFAEAQRMPYLQSCTEGGPVVSSGDETCRWREWCRREGRVSAGGT